MKAKRLVSLILSMVMLVSITVGVDASAFAGIFDNLPIGGGEGSGDISEIIDSIILKGGTLEKSGTCGENVSFVVTEEDDITTVTISGTGDMSNYKVSNLSPFIGKKDIDQVVIEDGVTSIGDYAFAGCDNIKSFKMANTVTYIGAYSLYKTSGIESMNISTNVQTIGISAFRGSHIPNVILPDTLTTLGMRAFFECTHIETLSIGKGITAIPRQAFESCNSMIDVDMGENVTSIEDSAFEKAWFENVTWPKSLTSIGTSAFKEAKFSNAVEIPNTVEVIGNTAFNQCRTEKIVVPNSVKTIGNSAFYSAEGLDKIIFEIDNAEIGDTILTGADYANVIFTSKTFNTEKIISSLAATNTVYAYEESDAKANCEKYSIPFMPLENNGCAFDVHNIKETIIAPATCTEIGVKNEVCAGCEKNFGNTIIPALGHDWQEATCETAKTCSRCPLTEGEPLGHSWLGATCTEAKYCSVCNKKDGEALGHEFLVYVSDNNATCISDGTQTSTCTRCDVKNTVVMPNSKAAHISDEGTITQMPTCTEPGVITYSCITCKAVINTSVIPANGHSYAAKVVKPTYFATGYTLYTCNNCASIYKDKTTKKLVLAKPAVSLKSKKAKNLTVSYKKIAGATGYQIQYATKSNFKGAKSAKVKSLSKAFTLKAKTKYYVRVRAYRTEKGKTVYSSWSTAKSIKTK